jgi:hypothetical protein
MVSAGKMSLRGARHLLIRPRNDLVQRKCWRIEPDGVALAILMKSLRISGSDALEGHVSAANLRKARGWELVRFARFGSMFGNLDEKGDRRSET